MKPVFISAFSLLVLFALGAEPAFAATPDVPYAMNFSGYLATGAGPVTGSYDMRFSLFVAGAPVWCAEYDSVSVTAGDFSVALGSSGGTALTPGGTSSSPSCSAGAATLAIDPSLLSSVSSSTSVQMAMQIFDGTSWEDFSAPVSVSSSMFALQANTAQTAESASNTSGIQGIAISATAPTAGQVLEYNGTEWAPAIGGSGTPAGSNGQIQFNSGGSFGASGDLTWDTTNFRLGVGGPIAPSTNLDVSGLNANGTFRVYDQTSVTGNTREIVRAGAGQSANLTEWQSSAGAVEASMSASGVLSAGGVKLPSGTGSITLQGASGGSSAVTWNLPDGNGTSGQALTTDGSGNLSWSTITSSGGTVTDVTGSGPISVATGTTTPAISFDLSGGDASISGSALTVTGIQGQPVSSTAPSGGNNILYWNGSQWQASTVATALGFTPANSSSLASYLPLAGGTMTGQLDMNTAASADSLAQILASTGAATNKGIVVQGVASQSANLTEWQNSSGTALASVSSSGGLSVPTLQVTTGASSGYVLTSDGSGNATWQALGSGSVPWATPGTIGSTTPNTGAFTTLTASGATSVTNNTASTSDTTGALVVTGGEGVGGALYVGGAASIAGATSVTNNTASTSSTTGALVVTGGEGLGGALNVGGALAVSGTSALTGQVKVNTATTADSLAQILDATGAATNKGLVVQGAASQSADLQEWQNSSGTALASVSSSGGLSVPTLQVTTGASSGYVLTSDGSGNATWQALGSGSVPWATPGTIGSTTPNTGAFTTLTASGATSVTNNTASTSDTTGALVVTGGEGVGGALYVGGAASIAGATSVTNNTASTSSTTGALVVTGGEGLGGALNVGGALAVSGTSALTGQVDVNSAATADSLAQILLATGADANKGLVVQAHSGTQSADLTEWQNSSGTVLASVNKMGDLSVPAIQITTGATNGYVLTSDGSGNATWQALGSGSVPWATPGTIGSTTPNTGAFTTVTASGATTVTNNTASTSDTTGALVVTGGEGVGGALYVGGAASIAGATSVTNNTASTSSSTGALTVTGGEGVGGALYVGGALAVTGASQLSGAVDVNTATTADSLAQILDATGAATNKGLVVQGAASQSADLQEWQNSSGTALASVSSSGGLSVPTLQVTTGASSGYVLTSDGSGNATWQALGSGSVPWATPGTIGSTTPNTGAFTTLTASGATTVTNNTASTSDTTGALVVTGGEGVGGALNVAGAASIAGATSVTNNTASTSSSTGALVVTGGEGLGGALNVGGALAVSGTSALTGQVKVNTATTADSLAQILDATGAATNKGLVVQGAASQSADLQEWQNSSGTALASISSSGGLSVPTMQVTTGASSGYVLTSDGSGNATWQAIGSGSVPWATPGTIGSTTPNTGAFTTLTASGATAVTNNTASTSDTTGALIVTGGEGVGGALNVGGVASIAGATSVTNNTASTSSSTGALVVTGGEGVGGALNVGGALAVSGASTLKGQVVVNTATTTDSLAQILDATGAATNKGLVVQGASSQSADLQEWQNSSGTTLASISSSGGLSVPTMQVTTGASSGYVLTSDGSGNATWQAIGSGSVPWATPGTIGSTTPNTGAFTTLTASGATAVTNNTASTSDTTGALVVTGGEGVGGAIYAGGAINSGSTVSASTSLTTPIIYGSNAASGTLTLDSTSNATPGNILLNTAGGNVAIGTSAPGGKFEIRGAASGAPLTSGGSTTVDPAVNLRISVADGLSNALDIGNYTASPYGVWIQSRDRTNLSSNLPIIFNPNGGNVGIGTTSPGALLDIGNVGTTLGIMRLDGNTSGYVQIQPSAAAGSWTMTLPNSAGSNGQVLKTDGSGNLSWTTVATGGSVGTATQYGVAYYNTTTSTSSTAVASANNQVLTGQTSAAPVFSTVTLSNTAMTFAGAGSVTSTGSNDLTLTGTNTDATAIDLSVSGTNGGITLGANGTGVVTVGGSTPTVTSGGNLLIESKSGSTTTIGNSGSTSGTTVQAGSGGITLSGFGAGVVQTNASGVLSSSTLSLSSLSGTLGVGNGGTGATTLTLNGVLYGNGTSAIQATAAGSQYQVLQANSSGVPTYGAVNLAQSAAVTGTLAIGNGGTGSTTGSITGTGALTFSAGGSNQNVTLTPSGTGYTVLNGDVGIGTTAPDAPLQITKTSAGAEVVGVSLQNASNSTSTGITIDLDSTGAGVGVRSSQIASLNTGVSQTNLIFRTSDGAVPAEVMRITDNGNVGIGTTNPGYTLEVHNSAATEQITSTTNGNNSVLSLWAYGSSGTPFQRNIVLFPSETNDLLEFERGGTAQMVIDSNGNVGIGTTSPGYKLQVNGGIAGTSAYVNTSDVRLKKNIRTIPDALEKIEAIRGVSFDWRRKEHPEMNLEDRRQLGVIAQEIEKVFPEAVSQNSKTGFKSVAYSMLIAPLIEGVKALDAKLKLALAAIERHDAEIARLKVENAKLRGEVEALKQSSARAPASVDSEIREMRVVLCQDHPNASFCSGSRKGQ